MTMQLVKDLPAIDKLITSIQRRGTALQQDMHVAACSVLNHFGQHQDIRVVNRMVDAMPDMSRSNALREWFETFGQIEFAKVKGKGIIAKVSKAEGKKHRLGEALDKPFWKFKSNEGGEYQPLDLYKRIQVLIKQIDKDAAAAAAAGVEPTDYSEARRDLETISKGFTVALTPEETH